MENSDLVTRVFQLYKERYKQTPILITAPGRINLIGEHTDYNMGYVFPAAVGQSIHFAIGPMDHPTRCECFSLDTNEVLNFDLNEIKPLPESTWKNYILGVVGEIQKLNKRLFGFRLIFTGDIPMGSGMSSSAALECGVAFGLNELFNLSMDRITMAKVSQAAEHNYAGVKCGIMDQYASMMGKKNQAFILDCRALTHEYINLDIEGASFVLCNSNVGHELADSAYNERRQQCEDGVGILSKKYGEVESLRDATLEMLGSVKDIMPEVVYRRCNYIIRENIRVKLMAEALASGNLKRTGEILNEAQEGMENNYEITCEETEFLAKQFQQHPDVWGARQMGGGFGGCIVALVKTESIGDIQKIVTTAYEDKYKKPTFLPISISEGCREVESSLSILKH